MSCISNCFRLKLAPEHFLRPLTGYLPQIEKEALKNLSKRDDIVIKAADKGGAAVVWSRPLYIQEALRQLSDGRFYERLDRDPLKQYQNKVKVTVDGMISKNELPPLAKNLIVTTPQTSRFYLLPKIHKQNTPGRPIVSACNCPTENIAAFLDEVMSPLEYKCHASPKEHQYFRTCSSSTFMLVNARGNIFRFRATTVIKDMDVCCL